MCTILFFDKTSLENVAIVIDRQQTEKLEKRQQELERLEDEIRKAESAKLKSSVLHDSIDTKVRVETSRDRHLSIEDSTQAAAAGDSHSKEETAEDGLIEGVLHLLT